MCLFKRKSPAEPHIPDTTKIRLYNGQFYGEKRSFSASHHIYSLCEWEDDEDADFPALVMDCAAAILADMPLVINSVFDLFGDRPISEEPEIRDYLAKAGQCAFASSAELCTVSAGIDRALIEAVPYDDYFQFSFCGYRELLQAQSLPPHYDVRLECNVYHYHLLIESPHDIGAYEDAIRRVCEKYGKSLCLEGFDSPKNES